MVYSIKWCTQIQQDQKGNVCQWYMASRSELWRVMVLCYAQSYMQTLGGHGLQEYPCRIVAWRWLGEEWQIANWSVILEMFTIQGRFLQERRYSGHFHVFRDITGCKKRVVINRRSGSMTCLTIPVGSGSSEHPLEGDFMTMRCNSTSLIEENSVTEHLGWGTWKLHG